MNLRWNIAQSAEIRWWQRYLKGKSPDEYLRWKSEYWLGFLSDCGLSVPKGSNVLDAGCGPAGIFIILDGNQVDALDPLLDSYAGKLPHFRKDNYPYVTFICKPLEELGAEGKYDTIFCLNAINHVADIRLCIQRLAHSLKPSGKLVISVDAHRRRWLKWIFKALPGDILHPHQYDLDGYKSLLANASLKVAAETLVKREGIFDYWCLECEKTSDDAKA